MMNTGLVDLCQSEPSCFRNDAPGPDGGEEADEGEGEEGGRDAQHQAEVWHHLDCQGQCLERENNCQHRDVLSFYDFKLNLRRSQS